MSPRIRHNAFLTTPFKTILTLVHLRRTHHTFPIRPFLPQLVDSLEDTDAHVRDVSRQGVIELFSGPAVTDAARADLKKEMTKKGVRKTIVDGVLAKLLGTGSNPQSREGSENGDAAPRAKEYMPPSMMLQSRKPSGTNTMSRTASASSIARPASRVGTPSPSIVASPTAESPGGVEVRPVYVRYGCYALLVLADSIPDCLSSRHGKRVYRNGFLFRGEYTNFSLPILSDFFPY